MPVRQIASIDELRGCLGQDVAVGEWFEVTQERITMFADATDDHQWIHVDVERCRRESPFGTTIAHGFLTLSLLPMLAERALQFTAPFALKVNYGANRIRFTSPVPSGSRIRLRTAPLSIEDVETGWQVTWRHIVEIEGRDKPALVAEMITRFIRG